MLRNIFYLILIINIPFSAQTFKDHQKLKQNYIQLSGKLFEAVQLSGMFKDSKTFVDAVPAASPEKILSIYDSIRSLPDFQLDDFVHTYFLIPLQKSDTIKFTAGEKVEDHIKTLWQYLIRTPDTINSLSTLVPLKYPYIVPGGRFREIYYWDSFFTILGLLAHNKITEAENMVRNFSFLIGNYGLIPNGNRVYYLTRSQPPFFSLMVDIICRYKKDFNWGLQFLPALLKEYNFWMNGLNNTKEGENASERVVLLNDKGVLNRYYDFDSIPREESYREDLETSQKRIAGSKAEFFRNIRAAAESGWDFSSRWFSDGQKLELISTTDILPVDLNCLLYFLEDRISFFYELVGNLQESVLYRTKADLRKELINKYFWDEEKQFFCDYNFKEKRTTGRLSLAASYPLYFGIAETEYALSTAAKLQSDFLKPGGLTTTLTNTHQQWDSPNGWPPLQWMAIKGLREYGLKNLADEIKIRWLDLVTNVYNRTGKMFEKYNVENLELFAGGGEYPTQDGFGWTNGVTAALLNDYDVLYLFK